jgi:chemotaxis protein CheD
MNLRDAADTGTPDSHALPCALPGFGHINRYWDKAHALWVARLLPGEYYVTTGQETIVTVLGASVSVCMRDAVRGIGGMNHFMLAAPQDADVRDRNQTVDSASAGHRSMAQLIQEILKQGGCRKRLEVRIIGGGRILAEMSDVGPRSIEFVENYIRSEGLTLLAKDVGDIYPRKLYYTPASGKIFVKKLRSLLNGTILQREVEYLSRLK